MKRTVEISSTEELLHIIRGKPASVVTPLGNLPAVTPGAPRAKKPLSRLGRWSGAKSVVGVEIGADQLRMVKLRHVEGVERLVDWRVEPLDQESAKGGPSLGKRLRDALADFAGPQKNVSVWTTVQDAGVNVWRVTIPRVGRKQVAGAVLWVARKEKKVSEAESVIDFKILGEVVEKGVPKLAATLIAAPRRQVEELRGLFAKAGYPLAGITTAPFAVQNLFKARWLAVSDKAAAVLHVGRSRSRIDIYEAGELIFSRAIMAGVNSMLEALAHELSERRSGPALTLEAESEDDAQAGGDGLELAEELFAALGGADPKDARLLEERGLDCESVLRMIAPALDRLVRQVERTFDHFSTAFGRERIENISVSGDICACGSLVAYIERHLGLGQGGARILEPADRADGWGDLSLDAARRVQLTTCAGVAFSHNDRTPNFLFTFQDKRHAERMTRISQGILGGFIVCAAVGIVFMTFMKNGAANERENIQRLQAGMAERKPLIDRAVLLRATAERKKGLESLKALTRRGYPAALLAEIAELTPLNIRLLGVQAQFAPPGGKDEAGKPGSAPKQSVQIEGVVFGAREMLEATLANFLVRLRNSALIAESSSKEDAVEPFGDLGEAMRFTITGSLR